MQQNDLSTKAMLVSLSISTWTARRFDKKATAEVAANHGTTEAAGRYNKNLLPVDAATYKAVLTAAGAARNKHYEQTLPWTDEGARILPAKNYMVYTAAMRTQHSEFNHAVSQFEYEYPTLQANAQRVLNGLYNPADYPSAGEIAGYFNFETKFLPFPNAADFRVTLQQTDVDAIKQQIETDTRTALAEAMKDPFRRLLEAVSHMTNKLTDPEAVFRDSLVNNLDELCKVVPSLNLTGDPALDSLVKQIESDLLVSPDTLRHSKVTRADIAAKAKAIQENLAAYMA